MNLAVKRKKLKLGFLYGLFAGLAFSIFTWGVDAWLLARAHATYPWVKFLPGLLVCILAGGITGWLTIRIDKHAIALLLWSILAFVYSWLAIWLPFTSAPSFIERLDPALVQYFHFSQVKDISQILWVSLVTIGLAAVLAGLLEINLVQQASISSNAASTVGAFLVATILFTSVGSATDQMINSNLREPIQVLDKLFNFAMENAGVEVPRQTARRMHLSAVSQLDEVIDKQRSLTLAGFDENIGIVDVLVDFEGSIVKCQVIYTQPTDCIILTPNP
jgi:hypothetical protein